METNLPGNPRHHYKSNFTSVLYVLAQDIYVFAFNKRHCPVSRLLERKAHLLRELDRFGQRQASVKDSDSILGMKFMTAAVI